LQHAGVVNDQNSPFAVSGLLSRKSPENGAASNFYKGYQCFFSPPSLQHSFHHRLPAALTPALSHHPSIQPTPAPALFLNSPLLIIRNILLLHFSPTTQLARCSSPSSAVLLFIAGRITTADIMQTYYWAGAASTPAGRDAPFTIDW
jgi:hypothetical protein